MPLTRIANPALEAENVEKPQSMQIKSFGNTKTLGWFRISRPLKWTLISVANSAWLLDAHEVQDIKEIPRSCISIRRQFQTTPKFVSVIQITILD